MAKTKKTWTQEEINAVIIEQDWECEGALRVKNPVTLARYDEIQYHLMHDDRDDHGIFFAFSNDQFTDGLKHLIHTKAIEPIADFNDLSCIKGKVFSFGYGMYGTKEGYNAYMESVRRNKGNVAEECNPQEVYCSEWNNFESMFTDDYNAIECIISEYGVDVARMIRRYNSCGSIDSVVEQMKKSA